MIVNLFGLIRNDMIEIEPVPVYFEHGQFVHVNEIAIEWKEKTSNINGFISSTLVDLCPVNPKQQILFFSQQHESNFMHYTPTHKAKYLIQCPSLQASVFQIHLSRQAEIEKIYFQIEISNAWNK